MALKKNPRFNLKLKYRRTLEIGMIASLCLLLFAFKYFPEYQTKKIVGDEEQPLIRGVDIPHTVFQKIPPPPPPPKPTVPVAATGEIPNQPTFLPPPVPTEPPPPPHVKKNIENPVTPVFYAVEEPPTIIGGVAALNEKVVYPELAVKVNIQGKVYVEAFIDENGDVFDVVLLKGIGGGCDEAAINAVKSVKFNPGKQRGKAVKVRVGIPIVFKLQ